MTVLLILLTYTDTVACSVPTLWQILADFGRFGVMGGADLVNIAQKMSRLLDIFSTMMKTCTKSHHHRSINS
ncbi:hypothetical protein [Moraxella nonliquefaciens]|uniref:hypothetical protein n=1 Tax=Moraxella nonliquefaciens TaxID=478 RepID=UPI0012E93102|nr:hypothetical protein [Moraxella nonliquefaciens]